MSLLMFLGLIGTIGYGTNIIKNDIKAERIDKMNKPTLNYKENKENIRKNFKSICMRAGIDLSKTGKPLNSQQCHKGIEYLQYQGYDHESVQYFKALFEDKISDKRRSLNYKLNKQHQQLLNIYNKSTRKHILVTYRHNYYGDEEPTKRMNAIMENKLWNTIVDNYTYIHSNNSAEYMEIWNLKVPQNFFNNYKIDDLYKEVCWIEGLKDGGFTS